MRITDLYRQVTASIVADLEQDVAKWTKPWKNGNTGGIMPMNAATKRSYNGINIPILWHAQLSRGYPTASWMTYRQATEIGGQVRGGEKSTHIVFTKKLTIKEKESEEEKQIGMLKAYSVFNLAQIDGLTQETAVEAEPQEQRQDAVTAFIAATKADIRIGGDRACYVPALDFITVPPESAFDTREHFLATCYMKRPTGLGTSRASTATSRAALTRRRMRLKS